jgi:hypothetical protein
MAYNVQANDIDNCSYLRSNIGFTVSMPLTLAAKVRTTVPNTNNVIVAAQSDNLLNAYTLGVNAGFNAPFVTTLVNGVAQFFTATTIPLVIGTYSQIAATFATNRRILYRNFNSQTSTAGFTNPGTVTQCSIGVRPNANGTFNGASTGDIAEVGVWNVVLSPVEVASLARGMTCDKVRPQSLVFYAPLVRDLQDVKGGLTITNNNTATVANHPRVYA